MNFRLVLLEQNENQELYIEQGQISLPFQVDLPQHLPDSFMQTCGSVTYFVNAILDIPW